MAACIAQMQRHGAFLIFKKKTRSLEPLPCYIASGHFFPPYFSNLHKMAMIFNSSLARPPPPLSMYVAPAMGGGGDSGASVYTF